MATGALAAALQDPAAIDIAAMAGSTKQATQWTPAEEELTSGRLAKLLSSGNPVLESARTKAAQAANRRGLLNSSMAVQAGEQAAIETATPIAQADAGILAQARQFNANAANTFSTDHNKFLTQGALLKGQGVLDAASQERDLGLKREQLAQTASEFDRDLNLRQQGLTLQQQQLTAQTESATAQRRAALAGQTAEMRQAALDAVYRLESDANMDAAAKATAINNVLAIARSNIEETVRLSGIDLPEAWPDWLSSYSQGGAGNGREQQPSSIAPIPLATQPAPAPAASTAFGAGWDWSS